ncbi:MAG: hypothetical protein HC904_11345 [Blastochloris sp.]|nr:hypothetical protein [Blastochloris sp.]
MKKTAILFVVGVFLPALVLGVLALQSARQQGVLLADQEAKLRQQEADNLAAQLALALRIEHETFVKVVEAFLGWMGPDELSTDFNRMLASRWQRKSVGFCVSTEGKILSPNDLAYGVGSQREAMEFIEDNAAFLKGRVTAEVYPTQSESLSGVQQALRLSNIGKVEELSEARLKNELELEQKQKRREFSQAPEPEEQAGAVAEDKPGYAAQSVQQQALPEARSAGREEEAGAKDADLKQQVVTSQPQRRQRDAEVSYNILRKVAPERVQVYGKDEALKLGSQLVTSTSRFSELVAGQRSGILSRFVNDRLEILFWFRSESRPDLVFGARLLPEDCRDLMTAVLRESGRGQDPVVRVVLDDRARPFVRSDESFEANWQRPFVAAEVGEILPHWELGLYLRDGEQINRAADQAGYALMGLIALALGAIAVGGGLMVADTRRQLALVQKKTDFVSNVSHELKTPLTSIRMFAELLQGPPGQDEEKRGHYLRIITVEAERLTRLINNVLDFARMERKQRIWNKQELDLFEVIRRVWEGQLLHLEQQGFRASWQAEEGPYPVCGDADGLAQVLVNLLSNAEKYSGEGREIELWSRTTGNGTEMEVSVLDRGLGVPKGEERRIFEHFLSRPRLTFQWHSRFGAGPDLGASNGGGAWRDFGL